MTLAESLLPKLSEWRPAGDGRHSCTETFGDWSVHVAADRVDSLSSLVWEATLTRLGPPPAGLTQPAWAAVVAGRATGLLEPLKVHEIDVVSDEAVLRSAGPAKRGELLAYYEVRLHGLDRATVRRFTASRAKGGREQVAFALTHEALSKLAGDIAQA